jgi:peptidoglycan/LPS O-acetylase OafA/YrhL
VIASGGTAPPPDKRLKLIDGLRGVAATLVMLFHLVGRTSVGALTHRGYLGVAIFFVLSGFVITSMLSPRRMSLRFLGQFALRRMVRLAIPCWVNIVRVLVMMRLAAGFGAAHQSVSLAQVAAHLFYLQDLLGYRPISSVYCTLCFEIQFYLTLALLLWAAQKANARRRYFLVAFLLLLGLSVLASMNLIPTPRGFMFSYWWAFALGGLCYWTLAEQAPLVYLVVAASLVLCSSLAVHGDWRLTALITTTLIFLAWRRQAMGRWLADPVSQFLGRISYSLYLCHPLFGWSAQSLALRYVNQWGALAVGIVVSLLSSWLTYRYIERPSVSLSHRVRLTPAPGAVSTTPRTDTSAA